MTDLSSPSWILIYSNRPTKIVRIDWLIIQYIYWLIFIVSNTSWVFILFNLFLFHIRNPHSCTLEVQPILVLIIALRYHLRYWYDGILKLGRFWIWEFGRGIILGRVSNDSLYIVAQSKSALNMVRSRPCNYLLIDQFHIVELLLWGSYYNN